MDPYRDDNTIIDYHYKIFNEDGHVKESGQRQVWEFVPMFVVGVLGHQAAGKSRSIWNYTKDDSWSVLDGWELPNTIRKRTIIVYQWDGTYVHESHGEVYTDAQGDMASKYVEATVIKRVDYTILINDDEDKEFVKTATRGHVDSTGVDCEELRAMFEIEVNRLYANFIVKGKCLN